MACGQGNEYLNLPWIRCEGSDKHEIKEGEGMEREMTAGNTHVEVIFSM